ncbi:MAG TPA: pyridoxal phosphate-dependent aminotransferase [Bauldia sp.]|nr:pyridoxal phosphate-dependent aminotransferase [Bauldia sp.]
MKTDQVLLSALRREARDAPESGIVEVFNYGRGRPGLIAMWAGEGDLPTPAFIFEAAIRSLRDGETFYTAQRGIPEVRAALARYHRRTYGRQFSDERFYITGGGMQAIQIASRMVAGPGDEVLVPTPAWPNISAAIAINGAEPVDVPLTFGNAGWALDLDRLFDSATDRTRAIFINSPANPTGWTATRDELQAILDFARERGLFIIADEVYHRFYYAGPRSPSFHDVADPDDRVLFVNTFSKNWAMTGWRIGWLSTPPALGQIIENLVQYSTSGVATFMQRAATVALDEGDDFLRLQVERARKGREIACAGLAGSGRARFSEPAGAFYLFFAVDGEDDTRALAMRLVDEANIGLAPGTAFGEAGHGFMRLCFASSPERVRDATERLAAWLKRG